MPRDPSKSEKPTEKRIRDAREEGNVISSQDVTALFGMLGGVGLLLHLIPKTVDAVARTFDLVLRVDCTRPWTTAGICGGLREGAGMLASLLGPVLLGTVVLVAVARIAQVGPFFAVKALAWKPDRLNPFKGVRQVLPTRENAVKLLLVMAKVTLIGLLAWAVISRDLPAITKLPLLPLHEGIAWSMEKGLVLLLRILGAFVVIAGLDYAYRRYKYFDDLMMSRQEIKDETRNTEGDPHVRGRQRQRMRELTRLRLIAEVPEADAVIVNPTHVAVAIRYKPGFRAPKIVAKGLRKRALRIRRMAVGAGVPVIHEPATARALYRHGSVGQYIPDHLFGAVAMILARLERLGIRSFSGAADSRATAAGAST